MPAKPKTVFEQKLDLKIMHNKNNYLFHKGAVVTKP